MIHDEIVTYEVAKLAKEKGFPQLGIDSNNYWFEDNNATFIDMNVRAFVFNTIPKENLIRKISQSLLQRWLREEKKYAISVFWDMLSKYYRYEIIKTIGVLEIQVGEKCNYSNPKCFDTYELALEDALKYALENLI